MKKKLLIASLAFASVINAQTLTQLNEPTVGQNASMYVCDSFVTNLDNITGTGVTWDYSQIGSYPGIMKLISVIDPASTPNASVFTTSTAALSIENFITTYYNSTSNARSSQGFVFSEPTFGDVIAEYSSDNEIIVNYPFAYSNSLTDNFAGSLSFTYNGFPQNPSCTGNNAASIDGQGTLLIGSTTVPNVIRYKIIDHTFATVQFVGDIEFIRTQYEYYDLANGSMPIFTHTNAIIQNVGSTTPIVNMSLVLSSIQPTNIAGIKMNSENIFSIYPNPSKGIFTINGAFNSNASITIVDQSGRTIATKSINDSSTTIDLSILEKGIYIAQIENNGTVSTQNIVIE
ncbi:MAG: T9SS type A sorting domain-containing protein [Flavobacteriia bacterium]|nr:T9SS type A sorting domain-containing protein [Flavobacteriia bacterium]